MQIRRERDSALTELEEKQTTIEELRNYIQTIETNYEMENDQLKSQIEELTLALNREKKNSIKLHEEVSTLAQVLFFFFSLFETEKNKMIFQIE